MDLGKGRCWALARERYPDLETAGPDHAVFGLLVDVADAYVRELELQASHDPAPFLSGTTPDAIREGRWRSFAGC
jgi:hypothetical protein